MVSCSLTVWNVQLLVVRVISGPKVRKGKIEGPLRAESTKGGAVDL